MPLMASVTTLLRVGFYYYELRTTAGTTQERPATTSRDAINHPLGYFGGGFNSIRDCCCLATTSRRKKKDSSKVWRLPCMVSQLITSNQTNLTTLNFMKVNAIEFITISNRIEGILRPPTQEEIKEFHRFMDLEEIDVWQLQQFVSIYQPNAELRNREGLNVRVGNHIPPKGGPEIESRLSSLLDCMCNIGPYRTHLEYETIHPFTDGNGRSGRMLWAWQMKEFPLGFLHHFYYQTLQSMTCPTYDIKIY